MGKRKETEKKKGKEKSSFSSVVLETERERVHEEKWQTQEKEKEKQGFRLWIPKFSYSVGNPSYEYGVRSTTACACAYIPYDYVRNKTVGN